MPAHEILAGDAELAHDRIVIERRRAEGVLPRVVGLVGLAIAQLRRYDDAETSPSEGADLKSPAVPQICGLRLAQCTDGPG